MRGSFRQQAERDGFVAKGALLRAEARVRSLRETRGIAKCVLDHQLLDGSGTAKSFRSSGASWVGLHRMMMLVLLRKVYARNSQHNYSDE